MADLLLEVDDELRARQIKALWAKYGQSLIGAAVVVTLGVGVGVFWHNHTTQKLTLQTDRLLSALDQDGKADLAELAAETDKPLKTVAQFHAAQAAEASGKLADAEMLYKSAAEEGSNRMLRELAQLHVVRLGLVQDKDAKALLGRIEPLTKEGAPYRASALEFKALLLRKLGQKDEAGKILESLATDGSAPNSIRQRARALREE